MPNDVDTELGFTPINSSDDLGFVEQPPRETYIQNQTPSTFMSKVNAFFRDPEMEQARAMNIYALSKATGISLADASNNYDVLRKTSKITGMKLDIDPTEFLGVAMLPAIAVGAVTNFPMTAAGLTAFYALDKAIPTKEWINNYEKTQGFEVKEEFKKTIDLVDFITKGVIAGGIATKGVNSAGKLINSWIEQKISEYKLPVNMAVLSKMEELTGIKPTIESTIIEPTKIETQLSPEHPLNFKTAEEYVASKKITTDIGQIGNSNLVSIKRGGKLVADATFHINDDGTAKIGKITALYGRGSMSVPELRELQRQIKKEFPQIKSFIGDRVDRSTISKVPVNDGDYKSQLTAEWQAAQKATSSASMIPTEPKLPVEEISKPQAIAKQIEEIPVSVPSPESIAPKSSESKLSAEEPIRKERGFITSVKESEMVTKETKEAIQELPKEVTTYDVYTDKEALTKAKEKVDSDPEGALTYVIGSEVLDKDVSTTGLELMRRYREKGDVQKEVAVASHMAEKATKAGQYIQAYSMLDKLSPEGVLIFAQREINRGVTDIAKRKTIDPKLAEELKLQSQIIQETPYGYQKVKEINKLYEMIAAKKGKAAKDWIAEIANVPRTLMSSFFDFSFGLRQGAFLMPSFAKEWGGAFSKQFGAFAKEKNYDALMDSIMKHPDFKLADDSGVAFTDIRGDLSKLEERYLGSAIAEGIPILGKGIRATQRAYTGMANKMRMDVFSSIVKDAERMGLEPRNNKNLLREISTFVNAGTGRGGLAGVFQESASLLNAFFFSPRLMSSRLTLLNPEYYISRTPYMRKRALTSLLGFMGTWASILTMAKIIGADVGTDPRSADFGKIKINKTRIDVGAGFGQYMRMFGQLATGKYVSSVTGKEYTLGEGYKPMTRMDILMRQIESKESPVFSLLSDLLKGQSWNGEKINVTKEVALRFTPMVIQDFYDLAKEDPTLLPLGLLTIFGTGVQTYDKPKKKIKF